MNLTCLIKIALYQHNFGRVLMFCDGSTKEDKWCEIYLDAYSTRVVGQGEGGWQRKREIFSGSSTAVTSAVRSSAGMTGGELHK